VAGFEEAERLAEGEHADDVVGVVVAPGADVDYRLGLGMLVEFTDEKADGAVDVWLVAFE
jgi:hypothetical protein